MLGLESSARARLRNHRFRSDVCESSPVGGCKYKRYVRYVITDEHNCFTLSTILDEVVYVEKFNVKFNTKVNILRKQHEFIFKRKDFICYRSRQI